MSIKKVLNGIISKLDEIVDGHNQHDDILTKYSPAKAEKHRDHLAGLIYGLDCGLRDANNKITELQLRLAAKDKSQFEADEPKQQELKAQEVSSLDEGMEQYIGIDEYNELIEAHNKLIDDNDELTESCDAYVLQINGLDEELASYKAATRKAKDEIAELKERIEQYEAMMGKARVKVHFLQGRKLTSERTDKLIAFLTPKADTDD